MSHIAAVQSAFPPHRHRQADLAALTADLCRLPAERRPLLDRLSAASGVGHRHTVLPTDAYHALSGPGALGAAAEHYLTRAADLGATAVRRALHAAGTDPAAVDLFVVTSVTGVAVPSLDAVLIPRLGLRTDLKRMPMFGLGCVGGAAGLARAHDYLQGWPGHTALVLAVELCSLSVPSTDPEVADLVVSTLFGDGAAAVVLHGAAAAGGSPPRTPHRSSHQVPRRPAPAAGSSPVPVPAGVPMSASAPTPAPHIVATRSAVVPGTADVLGWRLRSDGFRIVLTTALADIVAGHLGPLVRDFLAEHDLKTDDVTAWVCHPGGPRVVDAVRDSLGLPETAVATARASLAEVGNLSSASVLHVLEKTLTGGGRTAGDESRDETGRLPARPAPGSPGLLIGLGPGVSVELLLVRW